MITVCLVNTSTLVDDRDLLKWLPALQHQIRYDFAPHWGVDAQLVISASPGAGAYRVILQDDGDDPTALGYHLLDGNIPEARIFCRPTIADGDTVSSVLSHEILEFLCDPLTTRMNGSFIVECCDPVESTGYMIGETFVSNFVLPAYFGLSLDVRRYDFNGQLSGPCPSMLPGGYLMQYDAASGQWQSTFARRTDGTIPYQALKPGRSLYRAARGAPVVTA